MKFVMFGLLALAVTGFAIAVLSGAPESIIFATFLFMITVAMAAFVLARIRGTLNLQLDRRLPRALLSSDRR
jgi:hypothetical protein